MLKLRLIKGKLTDLSLDASKRYPLKNLETKAATSVLIGALTGNTSAATAAPILIMNKGSSVFNLTARLNNKKIIGQFSYIGDINNKNLIAVIDHNESSGYYLIYALLDPQSGLLYMAEDFGQSLKWLKIGSIKWSLIFGGFIYVILIIGSLISTFAVSNGFELKVFSIMLIGFFFGLIIFLLPICYLSAYRPFIKSSKLSEKVFEILGFKNSNDIDLHKAHYKDERGYKKSYIYEYRKVVENDPYPSDYFDKKDE